jgi:two-component system, LytTR family, sensor kinase
VLEPYLEISRMRFGARLAFHLDIDAAARRVFVPFFVLQPLVENALAHGIGANAGAGSVSVRAFREPQHLVLIVTDDGLGTQPGHNGGTGIGLANTRARLAELYGSAQSLEVRTPEGGGFEVRITVPWREAA